jgi:hypothetical protein
MAARVRNFSFVGAGLAGGFVFLAIELVLMPPTRFVSSDWILRLIASLMAGPVTLTAPSALSLAVLVPALAMHAALSLAFGYVLCRMTDGVTFWRSLAIGVGFGVALYLFNFYVMTRVFPWFATIRGPVTLLAHVLFGITAVVAHKGLSGTSYTEGPRAGAEARPPHATSA